MIESLNIGIIESTAQLVVADTVTVIIDNFQILV